MRGTFKFCLLASGIFASSIVIGGFFVLKGLEDSPLLDQRLSERYDLLRCFQKISEGQYKGFSACSEYAQFHYPLYPEFYASTPAKSACLVSKDILKVFRIDYPSSLDEINIAEDRVERNCAL